MEKTALAESSLPIPGATGVQCSNRIETNISYAQEGINEWRVIVESRRSLARIPVMNQQWLSAIASIVMRVKNNNPGEHDWSILRREESRKFLRIFSHICGRVDGRASLLTEEEWRRFWSWCGINEEYTRNI